MGVWPYVRNLDQLAKAIENKEIKFAEGSIIYLGGCNAGTEYAEINVNGVDTYEGFAQKLANITGAKVIAVSWDQVTPKNEPGNNMIYQPGYPKNNNFYCYEKNKQPLIWGNEADVINLFERAKTNALIEYMQPIPCKTVSQRFLNLNLNLKYLINRFA